MLAALPQFGFLVAVSTANLALGFVLGRRFRIANAVVANPRDVGRQRL